MEVNPMPQQTSTPADRAQPETKQAHVIHMLRTKSGSTIAAMMKATGWQAHSIRGFLSGTVSKKLGLKVLSEKTGDERTYRVAAVAPARRLRAKVK
jgi:hypothetical protein